MVDPEARGMVMRGQYVSERESTREGTDGTREKGGAPLLGSMYIGGKPVLAEGERYL